MQPPNQELYEKAPAATCAWKDPCSVGYYGLCLFCRIWVRHRHLGGRGLRIFYRTPEVKKALMVCGVAHFDRTENDRWRCGFCSTYPNVGCLCFYCGKANR